MLRNSETIFMADFGEIHPHFRLNVFLSHWFILRINKMDLSIIFIAYLRSFKREIEHIIIRISFVARPILVEIIEIVLAVEEEFANLTFYSLALSHLKY